jgi:hypothetical protein
MMENINELIEKNLQLLYDSKDNKLASIHFLDINNKQLISKLKAERFANELVERNLVTKDDMICILKEYGFEIVKNGGWLKHIETKTTEENRNSEREKEIQELTLKKLKFEQFPAKFWWLIIIIPAVISILTTFINNRILQLTNQLEVKQPKIILKK